MTVNSNRINVSFVMVITLVRTEFKESIMSSCRTRDFPTTGGIDLEQVPVGRGDGGTGNIEGWGGNGVGDSGTQI